MKPKAYTRIIVEGMDGSGKSTLVNHLSKYFGSQAIIVPGYNRIAEPKSPMPIWWMEQLSYNPPEKILLHDRFFYPEYVYGPVLRGKMDMPRSTEEYVLGELRRRAFLVYCRPPVEKIEEGVLVENQMNGVKERFHDLLIGYDKLMVEEAAFYNWRFHLYDWTKDTAFGKLAQLLMGYVY